MEILTTPAKPLDDPHAKYAPLAPSVRTLRAGSVHAKGALPLPSDVIHEHDVAIPMPDGTTIYADVFRPAGTAAVPAIISWAPYGKNGTGFWSLDAPIFPRRFGVPRKAVTGLQSWESPDPGYWCARGYAIVQIDAPGAFNSEGARVHYIGSAEGAAEYAAIEHIAGLTWCSGKIGLAGNSWLTMSQWHAAARNPPHLAAIAPWEGLTDMYRDAVARGGIPALDFPVAVRDTFYGSGELEDIEQMYLAHPAFDEYWDDKVADIEKIDVPAYVVASWTNNLHTAGTLRGWARLKSPKWLRVHNTHEWPDFYESRNVDDLRRFFDRYLKGIDNGWEKTPPVRLSVLNPGGTDIVDRVEESFPPSRARPSELFLSPDGFFDWQPGSAQTELTYTLDGRQQLDFDLLFDRESEIIGHPTLTLWLETDAEDADVYVYLNKVDRKGRVRLHQKLTLGLPLARVWMPIARHRVPAMNSAFYFGAEGRMRASAREVLFKAPGHETVLAGSVGMALPDGPVELTIPIWPISMRFSPGERLRLTVSPVSLAPSELPDLPTPPLQPGTRHVVHLGPRTPSRLSIPLISTP